MYSAYYHLERHVTECITKLDFDSALVGVKDFVYSIMIGSAAPGELIGSKKLDSLCSQIGAAYSRFSGFHNRIANEFSPDSSKIVIICTGLYRYGGTSLLIADLIKAHPNKDCLVLATNFLEDMKAVDFEANRIGDTEGNFSVAPAGGAAAKMKWLIEQVLKHNASRIFLLNHHQDSIITSAAQLFVERTKVLFVHHADYNLCLGVHMQGAIHADIHNVGYCNCRQSEGLSDNVYLPLVADDKKLVRDSKDFRNENIVTCSSGTAHKFLNFYLYPYTELVILRLLERDGIHVHIGSLPDHIIEHVKQRLTDLGLPDSRFVHIPWVKDLWVALIENNVDLFIGSFPIGGARTTLEVMGAGIPIMMHQSYLSRFYSSRDIVYPNHFVWKYPHQFVQLLKAIDSAMLGEHSLRSRGHYLLRYCSQSMDIAGEISRICDGNPIMEVPGLYQHDPDLLDRALHYSHVDYLAKSAAAASAAGARASQSASRFRWRDVITWKTVRLLSRR